MTPIANAIAQLGGPTAAGRLFDIVYQTPQQWIAQGRVPAEYCPRIEQLTGIRCEELNDRVDWSLIRGVDHSAEVRARMIELASEVAAAREQAAKDAAERKRHSDEVWDMTQKLSKVASRNHALEQQVLTLFGPVAAPADQGAKVRAAIADARHVFEGQKVAEDVLHYLEQVLAAGAPVPAQTGITPGTKIASFAKESPASVGVVAGLVVGADPFRAAARQAVMHQAHADLAQCEAAPARPTAAQQADISRHQAAIDRAAAAMAAESAKKVADAEWNASRCTTAAPATVDAASAPTTIARLVVEVDTTQLDAALAKAKDLGVLLASINPKGLQSI